MSRLCVLAQQYAWPNSLQDLGSKSLVPLLYGFFELRLLPPLDYVLIGAVVIVWGFVLRFAWRKGLFEWLLNLA